MPLSRDANNEPIQVLRMRPTSTAVAVTSTPALSVVLRAPCVRLVATQNVRIAIGPSPTAGPTSALLPAGVVEYQGCTDGDRISVVSTGTDGELSVTEMF